MHQPCFTVWKRIYNVGKTLQTHYPHPLTLVKYAQGNSESFGEKPYSVKTVQICLE